jgi:D-3-phosphoglycerate dehydrogenase
MKILIADKIADTALDELIKGGAEVDYLPEISPEELLAKIPEYEGLIVRSRSKVTKAVIEAGKKLKTVGRVGSGLDNIDTQTCAERKIKVVNAPDGNSQAVAEHTIGLMIALVRQYPKAFGSMKQGLWLKSELSGCELFGKTIGILGYGHIGKRVGKILEAIGAKILIYERGKSLEEFFKSADIITIHLPLTDETRGMVSEKLLSLMKSNGYLINASRGEIINEAALIRLIKAGKINGAALDVFTQEPLDKDSPLRKLDKVILTPHIGASTKEALVKASLAVVKEFLS